MYKVKSNDGDTWDNLTLEEAVATVEKYLQLAAEEEETKKWCSYEVYWTDVQ